MDVNIIFAVIRAFLQGSLDSFKGAISVFSIDQKISERAAYERSKRLHSNRRDKHNPPAQNKDGKVLTRVIQCCSLNGGVFLLSLYVFDYVLLPLLNYSLSWAFGSTVGNSVWSAIAPILSWTFRVLWVVPLFVLSKIINVLWFQDIANFAFESTGKTPLFTTLSKFFADTLFSVIIQFLFLLQAVIVSYIPMGYVGQLINLIHMSLLYSLYAFEYRWCKTGWELHKRLMFVEANWPYFIGFGFPLAVLTSLPESHAVSGSVFSIIFPLFIISANDVKPVTNVCNFQLQLFSIVVGISNTICNTTLKRIGSARARSLQTNDTK